MMFLNDKLFFKQNLDFLSKISDNAKPRMGGRAVECTGLENRRLFTEFVSSNLTPSAKYKKLPLWGVFCICWVLWEKNLRSEFGDRRERRRRRSRRDEERSSEQSHLFSTSSPFGEFFVFAGCCGRRTREVSSVTEGNGAEGDPEGTRNEVPSNLTFFQLPPPLGSFLYLLGVVGEELTK